MYSQNILIQKYSSSKTRTFCNKTKNILQSGFRFSSLWFFFSFYIRIVLKSQCFFFFRRILFYAEDDGSIINIISLEMSTILHDCLKLKYLGQSTTYLQHRSSCKQVGTIVGSSMAFLLALTFKDFCILHVLVLNKKVQVGRVVQCFLLHLPLNQNLCPTYAAI